MTTRSALGLLPNSHLERANLIPEFCLKSGVADQRTSVVIVLLVASLSFYSGRAQGEASKHLGRSAERQHLSSTEQELLALPIDESATRSAGRRPEPDQEHTPAAPSHYQPLTTRQKFGIFLDSTHAPWTFFSATFEGTLAQAQGQWPGYGGGVPGWGKRIGASLADTEARRFIQSFALSSLLHQDPRYFHSKHKNLWVRAAYAVTRVAVTKNDDGKNVFNSSELLGTLFTASLQNSYYPGRQRGFDRTMEGSGGRSVPMRLRTC
jgi:hypothetical protein